MRLKLKENPNEWRKAAWLSALGLALLASLLRWRRILPTAGWVAALGLLAAVALGALAQPRWFRAYYRFSSRLGFRLAQIIGYGALAVAFALVLTPLGLVLRLLGKDLLRLKRPRNANTYWTPSRQGTPLDRLF